MPWKGQTVKASRCIDPRIEDGLLDSVWVEAASLGREQARHLEACASCQEAVTRTQRILQVWETTEPHVSELAAARARFVAARSGRARRARAPRRGCGQPRSPCSASPARGSAPLRGGLRPRFDRAAFRGLLKGSGRRTSQVDSTAPPAGRTKGNLKLMGSRAGPLLLREKVSREARRMREVAQSATSYRRQAVRERNTANRRAAPSSGAFAPPSPQSGAKGRTALCLTRPSTVAFAGEATRGFRRKSASTRRFNRNATGSGIQTPNKRSSA